MKTSAEEPNYGKPHDEESWLDDSTGLCCLVQINCLGCWCGYVGVPRGHLLFQAHYNDARCLDIDVHGGLTFSGLWQSPNNGDELWLLGFDCCHAQDLIPRGRPNSFFDSPSRHATYKDKDFVKAECAKLAKQLQVLDLEDDDEN